MPQEIEIRPVRDSEYAIAGEITAAAYREFVPVASPRFAAYLARIADIAGRADRATVLVALVDGTVAGSATLEIDGRMSVDATSPLDPDEAHLRMLGVGPDFRRLGIARRLVTACIDLARARGKRRITLDTTAAMTAAQRLYTSMGFVATGEGRTPDGGILLGYALEITADSPATR